MVIVGIHNTGINSSVAILVDGELKFGGLEERFSRNKYDKSFPITSLERGLERCGLKYEDVDLFAIGWNPAINVGERTRAGFSEWPAFAGFRFSSNPNFLLPRIAKKDFLDTEQIFQFENGKKSKIVYVNHHLAHAAFAYYASGYKDSIILCCDAYGEKATTSWFEGRDGELKLQLQIDFPHSIGMLYSTFTEFLGFEPHYDEWKVMGASAYGSADRYIEKIYKLFSRRDGVDFELDLNFFQFFDYERSSLYSKNFMELFGEPRDKDEKLSQRHYDLAAGIQQVTEEYFIDTQRRLKNSTKSTNLCLSGGSVMNSVVNGILFNHSEFENLFIPYAPDDSGNSIGAALWTYKKYGGEITPKSLVSPFIGTSYSRSEIEDQLVLSKVEYTKVENPAKTAASFIADGKIIGWFQGCMEFGQRALGNRSILADPRPPDMKDMINSAVKFRESFRPFAPAVLDNLAADWFDVTDEPHSPYMEKVFMIEKSKSSAVPSVVHWDGSCRVQTVTEELNPKFFELIHNFYEITGVPIVLNTSFNLNNEPIVESPRDAIRTFYSSGQDILFVNDFLLEK